MQPDRAISCRGALEDFIAPIRLCASFFGRCNTMNNLPAERSLTYWDKVNLAQWGQYLVQTEKEAILKAQALAGQPGAAIDLGCGSGQWTELLSGLGWRVTSIDIDPGSLDICLRRTPTASVLLADPSARAIACNSASARLLVCIEVKVLQDEWFTDEVARVLADGGIFIGVYWNARSWRGLAWWVKHWLKKSKEEASFYKDSYARWKKRLLAGGFDVVYEEGFCWGPFGRESNSPLIPAFARLEKALKLNRWINCSPWVIFAARRLRKKHEPLSSSIAAGVIKDVQASSPPSSTVVALDQRS